MSLVLCHLICKHRADDQKDNNTAHLYEMVLSETVLLFEIKGIKVITSGLPITDLPTAKVRNFEFINHRTLEMFCTIKFLLLSIAETPTLLLSFAVSLLLPQSSPQSWQ